MTKSLRLVFVALLALVLTSACSDGKIITPVGPSGPLGRITVMIVSDGGTPLSGSVTVFNGTSNGIFGSKNVEAGSTAVFTDVPSGTYRVSATSEFYQPKEANVTIDGREEQLALALSPVPYDIRLVEVRANGQLLTGGEKIAVPVNLTIKLKVMNGTNDLLGAQVIFYGDPVLYNVGLGRSADGIPRGLHEVTISIPDYRACSTAGECVDRSRSMSLYVGNHPFRTQYIQQRAELPLSYER